MQNYMTQFFVLLVFVTLAIGCQQQVTEVQPEQQSATTEQQYRELVVEAACGQCVFGLPEKGCDLAIRTEGKTYYVDGIEIDDHGDAHADDGFCNAVRRARVQGGVENGRFVATSFALLPDDNE
jgi:hypothetical protein|tara:strand:+ start:26 stop:397 length:372 start_codon:yes stop_codon:yes gene_type:complete